MRSDVFISFKNTDENGNPTTDSQIAATLFQELEQRGIRTFYSNVRLFEFGEAAYKEAIETALDEAKILVVIASDAKYLKTRWVTYERESFHDDILSGRKKDAVIVPYLENIDSNDIPRSLRGYETFIIGKTNVKTVVDFVISCLKKNQDFKDINFDKSLTTGKILSRYNPNYGDEFRRLKIQARNTREADLPALKYVLEQIDKPKISVLDAGCAYGFVTSDRFGGVKETFTLAVDKNDSCIEYAKEHNKNDNIVYEVMNLEDEDFESVMEGMMERHGIKEFDIIFASLVLHHLKNPNKFLRRVRHYLSKEGFVIIRGSDDGSVLTCNDDGLIEKVIDYHMKADGISDRLNGRKIYSQLSASGYRDIRMFNRIKDLSDLDLDGREDVFLERFSYRRNYLQLALEADPYSMEKRNALEAMDFALDKLENKFSEETFWYCETDFVGVARKK